MSTFLRSSHDGELFVDHRASPGIPEAQARRMGLDPAVVREGGHGTVPTLGCCHCGGHQVRNPLRTRERGYCPKCDRYVCDGCAGAMRHPDYVHRTFLEIAELVQSEKFAVHGPASSPVLTRRDRHG